ncbi:MAG: GNAT family N-acetyltransferase [Egibacteraceae bacterium]
MVPSHRVLLPDDTPVLFRPLRPDDREGVERAFDELSPRTRYLRFHASAPSSATVLEELAQVEQHDHLAWVAIAEGAPDRGIGLARCVRLTDQPEVAETAVTVLDEYQRHGVGTLLTGLLGYAALAVGVRQLRAYVLRENALVLALLEQAGARSHAEDSGLVRLDLSLPTSPDEWPENAVGEALRAIAQGRLQSVVDRWSYADAGGSPDLTAWLDAVENG